MASVQFAGKTHTDTAEVQSILGDFGIPYERWGVRTADDASDADILAAYEKDIERLKEERQYVTADLVALSAATPGLAEICAKFDKEHHHAEDEVRFTVAGEGVFEIMTEQDGPIVFTAEAGDLIVIPKDRRHLFYLTEKQSIRCIRLFKSQEGWAAIY